MAYKNNPPPSVKPEEVPENYVDLAEARMRLHSGKVSTSRLRNLLSIITDCYHTEKRSKEERISEDTAEALNHMRSLIAYKMEWSQEKSRFNRFGWFIQEVKLLEYLYSVTDSQSRKAFLRFFYYLESLVAYHKYMGGKEE